MLLLESAVVVIRTNKVDTNIVDELKRAYDAVLNYQINDKLPEIEVGHRLLYNSEVMSNDSEKISVFVDGKTCLETDNAFGGRSHYYKDRLSSRVCAHCNKPNHMTNVLPFPAKQPTILIHVINKPKLATSLADELEECLNVLVFLKQPTPKPIQQLIITKTIEPGIVPSTIKVVGDGQTFYNDKQIWSEFYFQEQDFCASCKLLGFKQTNNDLNM